MVSDEDLTKKISELLDKADLTTTTTSLIRRQLEQEFGIDLNDRKSFVREKVDLYLQRHHQNAEEEEEKVKGCKEEEEKEGAKAVVKEETEVEREEEDGDEEGREEMELEEEEEEEEDNEDNDDDDDDNENDDDEEDRMSFIPERDSRRFQAKINRAKKERAQQPAVDGCGTSYERRHPASLNLTVPHYLHTVSFLWRSYHLSFQFNVLITCTYNILALVDKKRHEDKMFLFFIIHKQLDSLQKDKKKRAGGGGFTKLCRLSPELQALTGQEEWSRTQVVKFIWEYIRKNNLQDPANRRKILCDNALRSVFATDSTDMFKMNKLLTKHIWPLDDDIESKTKRLKVENDMTPEAEKGKSKEKQKTEKEAFEKEGKKGKGGGFTTPLPLSKALVEFLGTGENELPRTEVVKRLWAYIKENELQDPADKRQIKCDKKLQDLFGCDTFIGFTMTKHLTAHILKS